MSKKGKQRMGKPRDPRTLSDMRAGHDEQAPRRDRNGQRKEPEEEKQNCRDKGHPVGYTKKNKEE